MKVHQPIQKTTKMKHRGDIVMPNSDKESAVVILDLKDSTKVSKR